MATCRSMVLRSLRLLGEKSIGDTLSAAEATVYLADLNTMLDSWSVERLMVYQILLENFALTVNVTDYTIGSGGAFSTTRPIKITNAYARDTKSYDAPIVVIEDYKRFDALRVKNVGTTYPSNLYCDYANPLATIKLYPAPIAGLTLYIDSWKQLQQFTTIDDTVVLPPGYKRAIEFNFPIEVAGGYRSVPAEVLAIAKESKANLKKVNLPTSILQMPDGIARRRSGSILTGP